MFKKILASIAIMTTIAFTSCTQHSKDEQLVQGGKVKIIIDFEAVDNDGTKTISQYASGNIIIQ